MALLSLVIRACTGAVPKHFQGVEKGLKSFWCRQFEPLLFNRTACQRLACAALQAGEVVHITLKRAVEQFAAGEVAAAHPPCLLEHPQIPVNSRQAHALAQFAAQFVQLLAAQFLVARLKDPEDLSLAVAEAFRHATA